MAKMLASHNSRKNKDDKLGNQTAKEEIPHFVSIDTMRFVQNLDKTRVKLFPNFTRHHLITHTNIVQPYGVKK